MNKENTLPLASYPDDTIVLNFYDNGVEIALIDQSGDEPMCLVDEGEIRTPPHNHSWGVSFIYTHIVTPDHPHRSLVDAYIATARLGRANPRLLEPLRKEPHHGE